MTTLSVMSVSVEVPEIARTQSTVLATVRRQVWRRD